MKGQYLRIGGTHMLSIKVPNWRYNMSQIPYIAEHLVR